MLSSEPARFLSWDSEFFGVRIARVVADALTPVTLAALMEWRRAQAVDCLYFLADPNQTASLRLVEQNGFYLTDVRVLLDCGSESVGPIPAGVRPFQEDDRAVLRAIARASHHDSRFYYDGHFPVERCDDLYDTWIDRSVDGFADATLVADVDGHAVGYVTCHREEGEGRIGLVGVHPAFQGRLLGQALVKAALNWFLVAGFERVSVVTQGRNTRAQRLYQRCGFLTRSLQLWYHWWNEPNHEGVQK